MRATASSTQTRRHATLAHLLGIPHLVVAVNKMDLVGLPRGRLRAHRRATSAPSPRRTGIDDASCASCRCPRSPATWSSSAATNLDWYSGPTLLQILETVAGRHARDPRAVPLPGAVRGASRRQRRARAISARVESGAIAVGDAVTVLPSGRTTTRARDPRLRRHAAARAAARRDHADAGRRDRRVARRHARRCATSAPAPSRCGRRDAVLVRRARRSTAAARTCCATRRARCARASTASITCWNVSTQAQEPAPDALAMNDIGQATLALAQPIVADRYAEQPRDRQLHPDRRGDQRHGCGGDDLRVQRAPGPSISSAPVRVRRTS